jgi:hypothetical protein
VGSSPTIGTRGKCSKATFFLSIKKVGLEKERAEFRLVKARLNEGKKSPVDSFCDASASGPTIGTRGKCSKATFFFEH